jgi:hypothetical protein
LKRCGRCWQASYCGADCQKASWKTHKGTCLPLQEVMELVLAALEVSDWRGVLKWESRIDQLIATESDIRVEAFLDSFASARNMLCAETGDTAHLLVAMRINKFRVELLGCPPPPRLLIRPPYTVRAARGALPSLLRAPRGHFAPPGGQRGP